MADNEDETPRDSLIRAIAYLTFRLSPAQTAAGLVDGTLNNAEYIFKRNGGPEELISDLNALINYIASLQLMFTLLELQRKRAVSDDDCLTKMRENAKSWRDELDALDELFKVGEYHDD